MGIGRGAQLMANANGGGSIGGDGMQRQRGPQAKVFGIPEGTSLVRKLIRLQYYSV